MISTMRICSVSPSFSGKQFRWIGLSLVLGLVLLLIDVRVYENYAYVIYGTVLLLLLITIFIAPNTKGSHSWVVLGPMSSQVPAEFGKFSTALCLAKLFQATHCPSMPSVRTICSH